MKHQQGVIGALPPGETFHFVFNGGAPIDLPGPGAVTVQVVDRRVATAQRRARGFDASVGQFRRHNSGRREGDVRAHADRRKSGGDSMFARLLGRRSTDIPDRRHAPCILFGGRRALDPKERRSVMIKVYRSSSDPRVRLLERRTGRPYSSVTSHPPAMAARTADYYIPPENRK